MPRTNGCHPVSSTRHALDDLPSPRTWSISYISFNIMANSGSKWREGGARFDGFQDAQDDEVRSKLTDNR